MKNFTSALDQIKDQKLVKDGSNSIRPQPSVKLNFGAATKKINELHDIDTYKHHENPKLIESFSAALSQVQKLQE